MCKRLRKVVQIVASGRAFAAVTSYGSVVTWGLPKMVADTAMVRQQLYDVRSVTAAAQGAFAALRHDGSVVTWGDPSCGGDSSAVQAKLKGVTQIHSTHTAFAAIVLDGSVVAWRDPK